jgi:hypothetical protein
MSLSRDPGENRGYSRRALMLRNTRHKGLETRQAATERASHNQRCTAAVPVQKLGSSVLGERAPVGTPQSTSHDGDAQTTVCGATASSNTTGASEVVAMAGHPGAGSRQPSSGNV